MSSFAQHQEKVINILARYNMADFVRPYDETFVNQFFKDHYQEINAIETIDDAKAEFSKRLGYPISLFLWASEVETLYEVFLEWRKEMLQSAE